MRCRLAGVSDVVVADTRNHLKCYIQIQFKRKADCEKKPRKGSDPKDMCMRKVAHEVSIRVTKDEIYSLLDVWERSVGLLSKLIMAVTSSTGHDLTISCKGCSRGNRVCVTAKSPWTTAIIPGSSTESRCTNFEWDKRRTGRRSVRTRFTHLFVGTNRWICWWHHQEAIP